MQENIDDWGSESWDNHFEPVSISDNKDLSFDEFLLQEEGEDN